jgi:FtsZ-interacting cell division protein YlmF
LRGVDIVCYDLHVADEEEDVAEKEEDEEQEEDNEGEKDQEEEEEEENNEGKEKRQQEEENDDESDSDDEEEEVEVEQIYWMDVKKGTPKILKNHSDRTLFLCYPDDFEDSEESMALECLNNYTGDTVIHVGEMLGQTLCLPDAW